MLYLQTNSQNTLQYRHVSPMHHFFQNIWNIRLVFIIPIVGVIKRLVRQSFIIRIFARNESKIYVINFVNQFFVVLNI